MQKGTPDTTEIGSLTPKLAAFVDPDEWGAYLGHGGMTYGFLSEQGFIKQLNATFSAAVNNVERSYFVSGVLVCEMIKLAALELANERISLPCGDWYNGVMNVWDDMASIWSY